MRRMLIILGCLVVVIAAAVAGASLWAQQRAEQGVEAVFAAARADGKTASHGAVRFDLLRRVLTVEDIAVQSNDDLAGSLRIGRIQVFGIRLPSQGRLSAAQIEIADIALEGKITPLPDGTASLKAPRIALTEVSAPESPPTAADTGALPGPLGSLMADFAVVSVAAISIPETSFSLTSGDAAPSSGLRRVEYHYSGITAQGVADGKIRSMHVDKFAVSGETGTPQAPTFTGDGANMTLTDVDPRPIMVAMAPASPNAGQAGYQPVYARASSGAYHMHVGQMAIEIASLDAADIAIDPTKLRISDLMPMLRELPTSGAPKTPQAIAQAQHAAQVIATFYEGVRLGRAEIHGITVSAPPQDALKIAAVRIADMQNGRIRELAIDGLDGRTSQQEPVEVGHFALQGIGLSELMRTSARLASAPGQKPDGAELVSLLRLLDGVELDDLNAPYRGSHRPVAIDTAKISWGNFVGPIPSRARATLRVTGPIDSSDQQPFRQLAEAGFANASVALDVGAAWDEASRTFVLSPGMIQIANVGAAEAKATLANVPKTAFSTDPMAIILSGILVELGPIELTLHDLGGLDLAVTQMARTQNISADEARRRIAESVTQPLATLAATNGDFAGLADAVARFVETPGGTLTVKATPKGRVMLMQVVSALKASPATALANFHIEAGVSR